jgi:hypothetical protein
MIEYVYPTYKNVIDRALSDTKNERLASLPSGKSIEFINEAQSYVCDRAQILGVQDVRLITGQEEYDFGYTQSVTGTGTISSVARNVTGVGTVFLTQLTAGSIIRFGLLLRRVASITSDTALVLDQAFITDMAPGSGLIYDRKASEISVDISNIYDAEGEENGIKRPIVVGDIGHLISLRQKEAYDVRTADEKPYVLAEHGVGQMRKMKVYPLAEADKTITVYGIMKYQPRAHNGEDINSSLQLSENYERMVRYYYLYTAFESFKMGDDAKKYLMFFEKFIGEVRNHVKRKPYFKMVYR